MFEVEFYRLPDNTAPVEEFLDSLDTKMRAKSLYGLAILEEYGNRLREPYSKALGDGLFELRIKFASDITRIFYFFVVDNRITLISKHDFPVFDPVIGNHAACPHEEIL